jgi:hypothetical protein
MSTTRREENTMSDNTRAVEEARRAILTYAPQGSTRDAAKALAEGFGFTVTDPEGEALAAAAEDLGIDLAIDSYYRVSADEITSPQDITR